MAGSLCNASTGTEVATGTSLKTILEVKAPASSDIAIREVSISFDGVTATDAPIVVTLALTDGDGTGDDAEERYDDLRIAEVTYAIGASAKSNFSAASANPAIIKAFQVHPQGGGLVYPFPAGERLIVPRGKALAIRTHAGVSVNALANVKWEE